MPQRSPRDAPWKPRRGAARRARGCARPERPGARPPPPLHRALPTRTPAAPLTDSVAAPRCSRIHPNSVATRCQGSKNGTTQDPVAPPQCTSTGRSRREFLWQLPRRGTGQSCMAEHPITTASNPSAPLLAAHRGQSPVASRARGATAIPTAATATPLPATPCTPALAPTLLAAGDPATSTALPGSQERRRHGTRIRLPRHAAPPRAPTPPPPQPSGTRTAQIPAYRARRNPRLPRLPIDRHLPLRRALAAVRLGAAPERALHPRPCPTATTPTGQGAAATTPSRPHPPSRRPGEQADPPCTPGQQNKLQECLRARTPPGEPRPTSVRCMLAHAVQ